jgi:hypothetical protein
MSSGGQVSHLDERELFIGSPSGAVYTTTVINCHMKELFSVRTYRRGRSVTDRPRMHDHSPISWIKEYDIEKKSVDGIVLTYRCEVGGRAAPGSAPSPPPPAAGHPVAQF